MVQSSRSARSKKMTSCASGVLMALVLSKASLAQETTKTPPAQPPRPYRGLFATKRVNPASRQSIDFLVSATGANDETGVDGFAAGPDESFTAGAAYSDVTGALRYRRGGSTPWLEVVAGSATRYRPNVRHLMSVNHQLDARVRIPLWPSANVTFSPGLAYTPYYQFMFAPGAPPADDESLTPEAPSADFVVSKRAAYSMRGSLEIAQRLGARTALSVIYERGNVVSRDHARDLLIEGGAVRLTRRISQYASLHTGIGVRSGRYHTPSSDVVPAPSSAELVPLTDVGPSDPSPTDIRPPDLPSTDIRPFIANWVRTEDIDLGIDYARPLSASRRTRLGFTSGSSLTPQNGKTYYRVTGDALLTQEIGRTWHAGVRYHRALQYVDSLSQPFFGDGVSISVRGQVTRRVDVAVSGGYSTGDLGLAADPHGFRTYTGSTRLHLAVTRYWALFSEYVYYRYRFAELPPGATFPGRLDRHTARVGLKLWFPILD